MFKAKIKHHIVINKPLLYSNLDSTHLLIKLFSRNVKHLLKLQGKSTYTLLQHYKDNNIRMTKSYIYSLLRNEQKQCNILVLQLIANYLNIPLINLLSIDYTIKPDEVIRPLHVKQF